MGVCHIALATFDDDPVGRGVTLLAWTTVYVVMCLIAYVPFTVSFLTDRSLMAPGRILIHAGAALGVVFGVGTSMALATVLVALSDPGEVVHSASSILGALPAGFLGGLVGALALVTLRRLCLGDYSAYWDAPESPWPRRVRWRLAVTAILTYLLTFVALVASVAVAVFDMLGHMF